MRNKYVSNLKRSVRKRFGAIAMAVSVTATMGCFNQDVVRADMTDAAEAEASVYADVSENNDNAVTVVDSGSCGDNATYTLDSNGLLTISGSGEITGDAFRGSSYVSDRYAYADRIKKLVIENGITVIGSNAFEDCENLADITMPNSVVQIKESAFAGCKKIEGVIIPESVTEIGSWAFSNCGRMESIYIPKDVEYIGTYAFTGIISEITVADENKYYNSKNNCNAIIETATDTLIIGCGKTIIPDDVTKIGDYAFGDCSGLINIIIPEGVTKIGDGAFHGCSSLTSITIPESVTWIGNGAFYACGQMESIHIPKNVEHIGMRAFSDIRTNITVADENAYYDSRDNCNAIIETATNILITGCGETIIPNDVVQIGVGAFEDCESLTSITIPEGVTCIEEFAFENCSLTNIIIPKSVTSIGEYAFGGNKMDSITILNKDVVLVGRAFGIVEKNCTIHGYTGSTAEKYATEYEMTFKAIESTDGSEDNGNSGADTENPGSGDAGNSGSNTETPGGEDAGNGGSNTGNSGTGNGTTGDDSTSGGTTTGGSTTETPGSGDTGNSGSNTDSSGAGNGTTGGTTTGGSTTDGTTTGGSTSGNTAGSGTTAGGAAGGGSTGGATAGGGASVSGGSTGNVSTGASTTTDEKKDDGKVDKKVTTNKDGSVKEVVKEKETNSKGKEVTVTTTTEKDKKGNVTSVTEKTKIDNIASDASATVTVKTDKKGSITATASVEKKITSEKKITTISSSMIEQIKEAAGTDADITMTVKDEKGNTKYKVKADTADLKKGKDLYIYKLNTKTGEYVMVNDKTYSVSNKGNVSVKLDNKGTYELVSATDAKKIEKKILATVQAKKTAASVKKGKKTSIALSNKLNMSNVKSITYSTDSKSVATVSKKGTVTAKGKGITTIKATVTLKNGKTKTVKMKVTVK